jgi:hypothetical protein
MIQFDNVRFLNTPTRTGRQIVGIDIISGSEVYNWAVYAPLINGEELNTYFSRISNIVETDIQRKEIVWSNMEHTEEIDDGMGNIITVDIPKDRIVRPTIPDYIESLTIPEKTETELNEILSELGSDYWQYPKFVKRIIAPIELIFDDNGIKMYGWFQLNNFPILKIDNYLYLYCNTILPEHQAIVDGFAGLITIEDMP